MTSIKLPAPPAALKQRLLAVGPVPPEWGGKLRGGVTRFNVTLLEELRTRPWRHRIEPVGVLIPPPQRIHRRIAERLAPVPIFMQPEGGRPRRFTRLLLDEQRPDVVLVNNIAAFNGARYVRVQASVAPELPTIAVVHEWRAIRAKAGDEERSRRYREAAQTALDGIDAVVFPSGHIRDVGREQLGLRYPERQLVIANPLQPAFADPALLIAGRREGVAFVGSYNERKNPQSLIRALTAMPGLTLTMQGRGPLEDELRALTTELRIADRVEFAPFLGHRRHVDAVIDVMRSAELLCVPSRSEAFALVIVEALAAGTPVAGYGPTLVEIRDRLGIDVGEPIFDPTPANVGAAIEAVRARSWDREGLRRAALAAFGPSVIARRYARLIRAVARRR
ncbi:MAG TPA: glycosyltransferase family 4 protein [Solirubrobacterales bacterium]|nr:glycosyltransferase family 4 protein [Solirubrobacterales bacterium]